MPTENYKSVSIPCETYRCLRRISAQNFRSVPQQLAYMIDRLVREQGVLPERDSLDDDPINHL